MTSPRIFLLSPANLGGLRAQLVTSPRAQFPLAAHLRSSSGAPLGDVFSFLSGLYFRGKLAYARAFARPPAGVADGILVITPNAGLVPVDTAVSIRALRAAARVDIRADNPRYRRPLEASARRLSAAIAESCDVVLLGSVASPKYVEVLTGIFGPRLLFPLDFIGRGDMSRGGLMLRCAAEGRELEYVAVAAGTPRHGTRPPKLAPLGRHDAPLGRGRAPLGAALTNGASS